MKIANKGAFKYHVSALGGGSHNADTAGDLEGVGDLSQNADMLTLWREGVGDLKRKRSIAVKYFNLSKN